MAEVLTNMSSSIILIYQEFIASSEVAAIIAGSLVKEIYSQQMFLDKKNPIAKMINSI